jgi:hypothetical protein
VAGVNLISQISQIGGMLAGAILRWWGKAQPAPVRQPPMLRLPPPPPPPAPEPVAAPPPEPVAEVAEVGEVAEVAAAEVAPAATTTAHEPAFRFKTQLLDRLPQFERYLRRARKHLKDEDLDALARQGIAVCPDGARGGSGSELHPYFVQQMPTFGAFAFLNQPELDPESIYAKLAWFRRLKRAPFNVERESADAIAVYVMLVYWDEDQFEELRRWGHGVYDELVVEIRRDGSLRPLRKRYPAPQTIKHRDGSSSTLYRAHFGFGSLFSDSGKLDPVERISGIFVQVTTFWTQSTAAQVRVRATRGRHSLAFAIDVGSVPKFFDDREPVFDARGRRRSIFRIVRPHVRVRNGKRIPIKMHAAGLRDFDWNGWHIHISVPGLDHVSIEQMNISLVDEEQERREGRFKGDETPLRSLIDDMTRHTEGVKFAEPLFGYTKPAAARRRA